MAEDIRLFKLVTGEIIIGNYDADVDIVDDVATLQSVPMQGGGMQMMIVPYGVPFENTLCGKIEGNNILYRYQELPAEIKEKYIEVRETIKTKGGMGTLQFGAKPAETSKIIKN